MKNIGETDIVIAERFFFALDELSRRKIIRGLQTFTRRHDINYWNISTTRKHLDRCSVKAEWLAFLAQDYGVSCEWLLLGNGDIFTQDSPANLATAYRRRQNKDSSSSE